MVFDKLFKAKAAQAEADDRPILKTLGSSKRVDQMLKLADLKATFLQAAFSKNPDLALLELYNIKKSQPIKQYEHDLTLCFWFAIHLEDLGLAQQLLNQEFLLKQLVACALMNNQNDNDDDSEDDDASEVGEEWNINSQKRSEESFKSENFSEEEKVDHHQLHEGGERDDFMSEDEEDMFEENQVEQQVQQSVTPSPRVQQQQQVEVKQEQQEKPKSLGQMLAEMKKKKQEDEEKKQREAEQLASQQALEAIGITPEIIASTTINNLEVLLNVKSSFRYKFQNLMTNVLKIALQKEEEKLACIITAYYEVSLEDEMIIKALSMDNYRWLLFVWAFDKNYIGSRLRDAMFISYEQLFDLILKQHDGDRAGAIVKMKQVLDWKVISQDNILIALLAHNLDEVAIQYMGYYHHLLNKDLFIFCMTHGNNYFLKNALLLAAFDKMIFREEIVIDKILTILKEGYRTNFLMNILALIDISVWKNKSLKDLIEVINDYVEENYDKNRLLLSPNPLMSIALAAELLEKIGNNRRKFENECKKIEHQLLHLGRMYSAKIEDERFYENLITGEDFKNRTVLKIITLNNFEPLMDEDDPKAENLMVMIWHGKEATRCDGNIFGYSNLAHIIMTRAKKISGKKTSLMQMITNYYEPNFKVDYSFQYRYRSKAVSFYFYKEFFCAFAMLVIFQYINYRYLILFSSTYINGVDIQINGEIDEAATTNDRLNRVLLSIRDYVNWNTLALFFSAALIFQLILKLFYNFCSKQKIGLDKWTIMDSLSAFLNIIAVQMVQRIPASTYLNPNIKDLIDYFMIIVLCISWLRFFVYFLVVRDISKLLLTLFAMIGDTINFMFIVSCFILIMASVFTTLYQDTNIEKFGGLALSVRFLFDAAIGQYDYNDMGERTLSFTVLLMCHVFFSNILLLNYLVAILSTTYENMKQSGIFRYKVNLYMYCERFMIAFNEKSYGEIVLHPPPLSYLAALMIPFLVSRFLMQYISKAFSYLMYWLENILFIGAFLMFEIMMMPVAYVKVWINIIRNSMGILKTIINCLIILLIGQFLLMFLLLRDVAFLMKILCYHHGCRHGKIDELTTEQIEPEIRIKVFNETRSTVISLYRRLQKHMRMEGMGSGAVEVHEEEDDQLEDPDFFHIQDDENMNEDYLYVVKKSLIIDEWKKRRLQLERRYKIDQIKKAQSGKDIKSLLANSFKKKIGKSPVSMMEKLTSPQPNWKANKQSYNQNAKSEINKPKPKDLQSHLKVVFLEALKKENEPRADDNEDIEVDMTDFLIQDREIQLVDAFLTKFTIVSESSMNEHLDIMLMLKALPNKVTVHSLEQTEMFNFRIFQESLIAYQNMDMVNAFEYFDDKNRERVQNVKEKLVNQKTNLNDVKDILELVKMKIERNEDHFAKQKGVASGPGGSGVLERDNANFQDYNNGRTRIVENIHKKELNV